MKLGIRLRQSNFENLTQNFTPLELPTPLSHSLERLSKFYSVCIKCLTNEWQLRNGCDSGRLQWSAVN